MNFGHVVMVLMLLFAAPPLHFKGRILSIAEKRLALETSDGSVLTLLNTPQSKYTEKTKLLTFPQLREGDNLDVDVQVDTKGSFLIIAARLVARTDVDEAGPPKLKHRESGEAPQAASASRTARTEPPVAPRVAEEIPRELKMPDRPEFSDSERAVMNGRGHSGDPKMALIERAADEAYMFSEKLPNYVCQQFTTRYYGSARDLKAQDVVTAALVYENGKEDYRNISINGKAQNKKMMDLEGSTSTGEFGTILANLFHPGTAAKFKFVKESASARVTTGVYDFEVAQSNSNWEIGSEGKKSVRPAYKGTVWIDTSNARVMRIEMQTVSMPEDFPIDTVETAVDYDYVNLGTERYLLPVKSENLSFQRGSSLISKNVVEWRNYHKYLGESKIVFDK
jgi:hypothetical protein